MGCCSTRDAQDREVQKELDQDEELDLGLIKLLLLGSGGSGKSTLFKQLQYIHGDGFHPRQRLMFQAQIHEQLIESMKILIEKCEDFWEENPKQFSNYKLYNYEIYDDENENETESLTANDEHGEDQAIRMAAESILAIRNSQKMSKEVIEYLRYLWSNKTIQLMFELRNEICVPDSTSYFFNDLARITADDYIPNDSDLLLVRYRTTGMQEKKFQIQGHPFLICDVGGQRNERRKWLHFFTHVTSVIFVVSLSCYDELIFENETNAMVESLSVFSEYMNSEWFKDMDIIIFLNKSDLFFMKINSIPITVAPCFDGYRGQRNNAQESLKYIKKVFIDMNENKERTCFQHVTCATDRGQIEKVFNDVQTMIINWCLAKAGLT